MQKDLRTGRGHWRGCHTFENIICDGEPENSHEKRNGCLKMGGKYWYFVRSLITPKEAVVWIFNKQRPAVPTERRCRISQSR